MNKRFAMTAAHWLVLKTGYGGWNGCECDTPEIDGKRVYGNSDVQDDRWEHFAWSKEGSVTVAHVRVR